MSLHESTVHNLQGTLVYFFLSQWLRPNRARKACLYAWRISEYELFTVRASYPTWSLLAIEVGGPYSFVHLSEGFHRVGSEKNSVGGDHLLPRKAGD